MPQRQSTKRALALVGWAFKNLELFQRGAKGVMKPKCLKLCRAILSSGKDESEVTPEYFTRLWRMPLKSAVAELGTPCFVPEPGERALPKNKIAGDKARLSSLDISPQGVAQTYGH